MALFGKGCGMLIFQWLNLMFTRLVERNSWEHDSPFSYDNLSESVVLVRSDKYFSKESRMCCWKLYTFLSTIMQYTFLTGWGCVLNGTSCHLTLSCNKVTQGEGHHKEETWFPFKRLFEKLHKPLCKQILTRFMVKCYYLWRPVFEYTAGLLWLSCILSTCFAKREVKPGKLRFFKTSSCHPQAKYISNKHFFSRADPFK